MVTATQSKSAKTVKRFWLLQWQVRNLLSRTTKISQKTLAQIDKSLPKLWIEKIGVYGLDSSGHRRVGLELTINWLTCGMHIYIASATSESCDEVTIDRTVYTADDLAPEVMNAIEVFKEAVNAELLRTKWRVFYAQGVDVEQVRRELGFVPAPPLTWAEKVEKKSYAVPELPELTVTFSEAVPEEISDESPESLFETDAGKDKGWYDRIIAAFG